MAGLYTFSGSGSDTVRVTNNCAATGGDTVGTMYVGQSGIFTQVAPGNYVDVLLSGGNFGLYGSNVSGNLIRSFAIQVTGGGTNNNGGTASAQAAAPEPVLETLSLSVEANGASCTGGNPTGSSGTWLALPKADDCKQTGPNAKAGAKLLGWSPNANFPVEVAQNQIARGWGVFDGPIGGVRMIFIPAGMSTFVSGSNTLFPVWSA